jgi:hypothetical protein
MGSMSAQLCISDIENENKNLKTRTETLSNEMIIRKSSIKSIGLDNDKLNELMNKNKFTEENLVYIY